jgi:hypothetical protein
LAGIGRSIFKIIFSHSFPAGVKPHFNHQRNIGFDNTTNAIRHWVATPNASISSLKPNLELRTGIGKRDLHKCINNYIKVQGIR